VPCRATYGREPGADNQIVFAPAEASGLFRVRTFELFEPLRLFLKTNLEGSKDSKNLEGAWILDTQ